jgi:hypothetical protein
MGTCTDVHGAGIRTTGRFTLGTPEHVPLLLGALTLSELRRPLTLAVREDLLPRQDIGSFRPCFVHADHFPRPVGLSFCEISQFGAILL